MRRFMISDTEFYDRFLTMKESEMLLREREVEALESIAEYLKTIANK